jgi:hypothetical protein
MQFQPAPRDGELQAGAVFRRRAFVAETGTRHCVQRPATCSSIAFCKASFAVAVVNASV